MRVAAPDIVLDGLAVPGQDVRHDPGRLGGRQARRAGHPVDQLTVKHPANTAAREAASAKFLPEYGQELEVSILTMRL